MKEFLKKHISKIIIIFLVLQPIIDLLTAISINVFHLDITFGIIIRVGFLLFLTIYNYFVETSGKRTKTYFWVTLVYMILFMINIIWSKDISCMFYELKNIVRYFYFPLLLINLYEVNKRTPITISNSTLVKTYFIYILLILIPMLTHTDFAGYFEGKVGSIGWFHSTNEISAILSGLLPIVFLNLAKNKKSMLLMIPIMIVLFSLGSKITIVALFITVLFYGYFAFKKSQNKKRILLTATPCLIVGGTIILLLLPKTNFYKNIRIHLDFLGVEQITDVFKDEKLIDHFIFSSRLTFLKNTRTNYIVSSTGTKLLGLGFIENYATDQVNLKTIEMDIFDIFYRTGLVGTFLYFLPFFWITKEDRDKRRKEENLSIGMFLFISLLAGHVLTSPAVSIYLAILILNLQKEDEVCKLEL